MSKRLIKSSWLQDYLRYTDLQESPELFHLWVGATIISAVLDRKVYVDYGYFQNFPNIYVILVAGSQKCRKSTAIKMGVDIMNELENPPFQLSQKVTPQALISSLEKQAQEKKGLGEEPRATGMIVADEISTYLDASSIQMGMLPVLLKLHDCQDPFEYRTQSRGKEILPKTYATLLAGSAPEYLRKSLPIDEAGGGMLARTILVYQDTPRVARPFLSMDDSHQEIRNSLVHDLEKIAKLKGKFNVTKGAHKWYEEWYTNWHSGKDSVDVDSSLRHYIAKKPDHLQALSQILSVAENDKLELTPQHFKRALRVLNETEKHMHKPLSTIVSEGKGLIIKTVRDAIATIESYKRQPTYKLILRRIHKTVDFEDMRKALDTLTYAGIVEQRKDSQTDKVYFVINEDIEREDKYV